MTGPLLITGGTGLLGTAVRELAPDALVLSRADGDLRDAGAALRLLSEIRPARLLHLAALVGGVKANAADNQTFFEDNVLINTSVLSAARRLRVPKLIAILSSCAFPFFPDRPSDERDLHAGAPFTGSAGYGCAKRTLDLHVRMAADQDLDWTTIAPVTMYGPHDSFDSDRGHVVGALIRRCWEAKTNGTPFTVWGSGRAVRQFVYVRDVARVLLEMLSRRTSPATTIVAPDDGVTIKILADRIARAMDYRGPILFDDRQPEGLLVKRLRRTAHPAPLGLSSFTALKEGLAETVRWFVAHHAGAESDARQAAPLLCR